MIVHRFSDGSEGYEYEIGDIVEITDVVGDSAWFRRSIGRSGPVVEIKPFDRKHPCYHTAEIYVRDLPDWGPSHCMAWQVKPTAETKISRVQIETA